MSNKQIQNYLRTEAEALLAREPLPGVPARPASELLHELQVYQVELEMQNEELRRTQLSLEDSRDRYVDLYEFAPVGYLTLTRTGVINEVNLTGAALLGVERKKLLRRRFSSFVSAVEHDCWQHHFLNVLRHDGRQTCELALRRGDSVFHAQLDCLRIQTGGAPSVRIAFTDISERKCHEQQLRELSAHLRTVREEEKASFAREIHDELGGTLAALKMDAYWLAHKLAEEKSLAPLQERAESMHSLLDEAVQAMRRIITDLRPAILDDLGLLAALKWQSAQFHKHTGIECELVCSGRGHHEGDMEKTLSINLFRIFQETLTNVARHSGASRVRVKLHYADDEIILAIGDNGHGLSEGHTIAPTSYGIRGLRERVAQLGGKIKLDSPPGSGLSVTVTLPLPAAPQADVGG